MATSATMNCGRVGCKEKTKAVACHLAAILGNCLLTGIGGLIFSFVTWKFVTKGEPLVESHGNKLVTRHMFFTAIIIALGMSLLVPLWMTGLEHITIIINKADTSIADMPLWDFLCSTIDWTAKIVLIGLSVLGIMDATRKKAPFHLEIAMKIKHGKLPNKSH